MDEARYWIPSPDESTADRMRPAHLHAAGRSSGGVSAPTAAARERFTRFRDREDAGQQLGRALHHHRGENALVLGIPRGGAPVAAEVARLLDAELDVVVARKVGAPENAELALGAVTADGGEFLNQGLVDQLGVPADWLRAEVVRKIEDARQRERFLRSHRPARPIEGRTVIVVDDGLATGATMRASVRAVRKQRPAKLIAAVPVGSVEACAALEPEVDEVLCLGRPEPFFAVGLYYEDFAPTSDQRVRELLDAASLARR
jgi:predicted phosphoribosyltransferase